MLNPSIDSLLEKIDSKYSLVSIAAKRARALQKPNTYSPIEHPISYKSVGRALEEIDAELLTFQPEE